MSQPVFKNWFTASGRRNRRSYILAVLAQLGILLALVVPSLIAALVSYLQGGGFAIDVQSVIAGTAVIVYALLIIVVAIAFLVAGFFIGAQRLRDMGYRGWWVLVLYILVPIVMAFVIGTPIAYFNEFAGDITGDIVSLAIVIALASIPGNKGKNRFGADPLAPPSSKAKKRKALPRKAKNRKASPRKAKKRKAPKRG